MRANIVDRPQPGAGGGVKTVQPLAAVALAGEVGHNHHAVVKHRRAVIAAVPGGQGHRRGRFAGGAVPAPMPSTNVGFPQQRAIIGIQRVEAHGRAEHVDATIAGGRRQIAARLGAHGIVHATFGQGRAPQGAAGGQIHALDHVVGQHPPLVEHQR